MNFTLKNYTKTQNKIRKNLKHIINKINNPKKIYKIKIQYKKVINFTKCIFVYLQFIRYDDKYGSQLDQ